MKFFLAKVLYFFIPLTLIAIVFEVVLQRAPCDYKLKNNYLKNKGNNIEVLILGSSHSFYGLNASYFTKKSFNASYVAQTVDIDYEILKKFEAQLTSLQYIVLPLSYFTLTSQLQKNEDEWRVKNYNIYYDIHLRNKLADNFELLSNSFNVNCLKLYNLNFKKETVLTCDSLGWGFMYNSKVKNDFEQTAIDAVKRQTKSDDFTINQNIAVIKKIIAFATKKNIKIILYTPPAHKAYVDKLDKKQMQRIYDVATNVSNENNNTKYLNFIGDKDFEYSDFYDADHLNEVGAKKLSNKINSIILTF